MTPLPRIARALLASAAAALCLGQALAQPLSPDSKTYYVGGLAPLEEGSVPEGWPGGARDRERAGPGGEGEGSPSAAAEAPAVLDLSLWDDGFAFARLQLPTRRAVLYGSGWLKDGTELRLVFRPAAGVEDPWWAAELARRAAAGELADEPRAEPVAVLTAMRDYDWAGEGRTVEGVLRFATGEPLRLTVARLASAARWSFSQGRVYSTAVMPRFPGQDALNEWLQERALPAMQAFAVEGLVLDDAGELGWGWWREERIELTGAAGPYLSLLSTTDDYTGGAHPNSFHASYLVALAAAEVEALDLADLFAAPGWVDELSDLVLADLAEQGALWVTTGQVEALSQADLGVFTLDAQGVTFHFSPYLMGPYAQGTFRVTLPYESLEHLADPDGPLAAFARGDGPRAAAQR